jgi:translation initiation factor IF-2
MNISELARRLRANPEELREKLPLLGFDVGSKAIKVDDRLVNKIQHKWGEYKRTERLKEKYSREQVIREAAVAKVKKVELPGVITVRDFAMKMQLPITIVMSELMKNGILANLNERIDFTTASIVAGDLGFEVATEATADLTSEVAPVQRLEEVRAEEKEEDLVPRPPVVVVMGHVDHGKTQLLDTIRKTSVVKKEAGGITQHIGAYQAEKKGRKMTFIDTPGHEAFTVMRSRGARVADVAILVVAADDGVQPQTIEVIKIIQAAKLPLVVALNKIDKPDIDIQRVKTQLSEQGLIPEDWGGTTTMVQVSGKTGQGIDELLDMILLVADLDKDKIRANPKRSAVGTIIESHVDKGEGPVSTILVQTGTLRQNDYLAVGDMLYGRVRAMKDWNGDMVFTAVPGTPVKVLGLKVSPSVGDVIEVPKDYKALKQAKKQESAERQVVATGASVSREENVDKKMLNVLIKADVLGSLEAIVGALEKMQSDEVGVAIVGRGLGNVTENDILRAEATGGIVFGFNVKSKREAEILARDKKVSMYHETIIYRIFDEVKKRLQAMVPVKIEMKPIGKMKVLATFRSDKHGQVVGGLVVEGHVEKGANVVAYREDQPVSEGVVVGVQLGKSEAKEARMGQECGVKVQSKNAIMVGDVLEVFFEIRHEKKLEFSV